jgi:hypothetical protein
MKHQIALVGGQLLPIYVGIKEYNPDFIHFIVSPDSKNRLTTMRSFLKGKKVSEVICDPYNFESARGACYKAIEKLNPGDEISFNLTGGTKIMVLAAQFIMQEKKLNGFYINQADSILELPGFNESALNSSVTIEEFFELSGHQLSSFKKLKDISVEDKKVAILIENFALQNDDLYFKLTAFIQRKYKNLSDVPASGNEKFNEHQQASIKWAANKIEIIRKGKSILSINSPLSRYMLFNTGWWEFVVAESIANWSKIKDLRLHCELPFRNDKSNMKNEIDILLNLGRQMIFIECKSGQVKQEDINKMKVIKDTYGGIISKSILVSRFMVTPGIYEKCKELGIEVFYTMLGNKEVNSLKKLEKTLENLSKQSSF